MLLFAATIAARLRLGALRASEEPFEDAKRLFILIEKDFGSKSPAMHNAAFEKLDLPYDYGVVEMPKEGVEDRESVVADVLRAMFKADNFGGASVTIPHKQIVAPYLDELSTSAQLIGAVNTVIPTVKDGQRWNVGDNTDWIGVSVAVSAALARQPPTARRRALLVGSGGTARAAAYALTEGERMDPFELYVYARDDTKAHEVAASFGGKGVTFGDDLDALLDDGGFSVVVSTIPGDSYFALPSRVLDTQPAVLDAAYKPAETELLRQAMDAGCPISQGATMLVEQGIAQFELWTGMPAPADVMRAAVFDGIPCLEGADAAGPSSDLADFQGEGAEHVDIREGLPISSSRN